MVLGTRAQFVVSTQLLQLPQPARQRRQQVAFVGPIEAPTVSFLWLEAKALHDVDLSASRAAESSVRCAIAGQRSDIAVVMAQAAYHSRGLLGTP